MQGFNTAQELADALSNGTLHVCSPQEWTSLNYNDNVSRKQPARNSQTVHMCYICQQSHCKACAYELVSVQLLPINLCLLPINLCLGAYRSVPTDWCSGWQTPLRGALGLSQPRPGQGCMSLKANALPCCKEIPLLAESSSKIALGTSITHAPSGPCPSSLPPPCTQLQTPNSSFRPLHQATPCPSAKLCTSYQTPSKLLPTPPAPALPPLSQYQLVQPLPQP